MQFISFRVIMRRIKAIRYMMADKTVPKRKKLLVIFCYSSCPVFFSESPSTV